MSRLERIAELSAKTPRTTDEQAELQRLAREEIAWREQRRATEARLPVYPVGMRALFGKRDATITGATQDAAGVWHYTIDLKSGEFLNLGSGTYTKTEAEVRAVIADQLGALAAGQAFPKGIKVYRNGVGGVIQSSTQDPKTGEFYYGIGGWGAATVAQSELTAAMRAA